EKFHLKRIWVDNPVCVMEEVKGQRGSGTTDADFVLQWGGGREREAASQVMVCLSANSCPELSLPREAPFLDILIVQTSKLDLELFSLGLCLCGDRSIDSPGNVRRSFVASPEKEDRYYTTRGSMGTDESGKLIKEPVKETKKHVWPKLFMTLSNKEKEEDFLAMKGCKLPQRPKKRAKLVQMTLLLLVSPGTWLSDLCKERYEVREKKTSKKRPRGLKAMGSMESDSE
ncbi:hypothetical protein HID58_070215, partial [Brassica napus]